MNYVTVIIGLVVVIAVIAVAAYLLRKAGFTVNKIKAMIPGVMEVEAGRAPAAAPDSTTPGPAQFSQEATGGGVIEKARIKAAAGTPATASQKATGPDSRLDDVTIEVK